MKRGSYLIGLFFLLFGLFAEKAIASDGLAFQAAPLSPAFLAYQESLKQQETPSLRGANPGARPTGYIPSPVDLSHLRNADYSGYLAGRRRADPLPVSYDLRKVNGVTEVKDQGNHGICWTFSALGSMESVYLKQGGAPLNLSEMHLAYYAFHDPISFTGKNNFLQQGGNDTMAVATLARWTGPVLEADAPYGDTTPTGRYQNRFHLQDAYFLGSAAWVEGDTPPTPTEEIRKQLIMDYGGISVGYYATGEDTAYNRTNHAWYNSKADPKSDHAVLIVGWDDDYSRDNFNEAMRPENNGAWLVKNSWGTNWGDGGYFWLSYEDKTLESGTVFIPEEVTNYDNIYEYDDLGWCISLGAENGVGTGKEVWMANVFTASDTETLKAVSFYTTDNYADYEISIYTRLSDPDDPDSGTLVASQSGSETFAGYHTVWLTDQVSLAEGTSFAVVVKVTNQGYAYPMAAEAQIVNEQINYSGNAVITRRVSFVSSNGDDWTDAASLSSLPANVCIKAFTTNSSGGGGEIPAETEITARIPDEVNGVVKLNANEFYSGQIYATPAGAAFSATGLPSGLTLTPGGLLSGTVLMEGAYSVTLTVTAPDGRSKTFMFTVEVGQGRNIVTGITLDRTMLYLKPGDIDTLTAIVMPLNATNQAVTWSSSDPYVAGIDTAGNVTAIAPGTATITVTANDGGWTAACTVTVTSGALPEAAVTIDFSALGLEKNVLKLDTGDYVIAQINAKPSGAVFMATGLPPGLTLTRGGQLSGSVQTEGRYVVAVIATAPDGTRTTRTFTVEVSKVQDSGDGDGRNDWDNVSKGGGGGCDTGTAGLFALLLIGSLGGIRRKS